MTKAKVFITTAIDYTNDVIHIGHAYEKIVADAIARFYRLKLGTDKVLFTVGTDEHGTTNEKAAQRHNTPVAEYVKDISLKDKAQLDSLNISYNRFIKTTDSDHKKIAAEFFKKAYDAGDVYKAAYKGLYCEGCESYKTLSELNANGQCPNHTTRQIQTVEEENYFFKWAKYTPFLKNLITSDTLRITPEGKKREMLAFIDQGITDIPITRPKYKVAWGIECPVDQEQVIYVWFDALINYYTEGSQKGFWDESTHIIHVVGKDIARWHTLLWPAMLKSAGLKLPNEVVVHSFISLNGEKISKSKGNVILPSNLVAKYGADAVRYYMLTHGPVVDDSDISIKAFEEVYNADLANGLGNVVARVAKLCEKWRIGLASKPQVGWAANWAKPLLNDLRTDQTIANIWEHIKELDKHINQNEPWKITEQAKANTILDHEAAEVLAIALKLEPFMPQTSQKIQSQFLQAKISAQGGLFPRLSS